MPKHWSVQEAKARLSEVLRRARKGEPQHVGLNDGCVVVSEDVWAAAEGENLGAWLVESAPRGESVALPSRRSRRGDPFAPARRSRRP
ncbi:MAG TPA: type II toxin-antitoxin system prevent-host-death family antitoxin [Rhizomicrobium sp.]|nr:type II toxin-antitoxin system prevent-host-death family antitoxin [Rhizomicrobium sp.]